MADSGDPEGALREALQDALSALSSHPDALLNSDGSDGEQNLWRWWNEKAVPAIYKARDVLKETDDSPEAVTDAPTDPYLWESGT